MEPRPYSKELEGAEPKVDTHNKVIVFGKHKGERWTRLPISYLKWIMNELPKDGVKE